MNEKLIWEIRRDGTPRLPHVEAVTQEMAMTLWLQAAYSSQETREKIYEGGYLRVGENAETLPRFEPVAIRRVN